MYYKNHLNGLSYGLVVSCVGNNRVSLVEASVRRASPTAAEADVRRGRRVEIRPLPRTNW